MTEMMAHPAAAVDRGAILEEGVEVGPFAVIGPHVTLRKNAKIHSHAVVTGRTEIGEGCEIHPFASRRPSAGYEIPRRTQRTGCRPIHDHS